MKRLLILAGLMVLVTSCSATHSRQDAPRGASVPLVTFVFDDGDDTDYLVGREIFAQQGTVACSAVTTGWINAKNHLTHAQIIALRDSGWEIMSHTVTHPNLRSLTQDELDAELSRSKATLESMGLTVNNLVYPFNMNNEPVRTITSKYYRSGRGGASSFNAGSIDPYFLKSFSMKHDIPRMKEHIDRAYAEKSWLIFYQHEIDIKVKLSDKQGTFTEGETLTLNPSGALARYVTVHWFPIYGFAMYLVPFSGMPQPGDTITGSTSGATARLDTIIYNEPAQLTELIRYIQTRYPDMRIVTIDQGLDLLGVPKFRNSTQKHDEGK